MIGLQEDAEVFVQQHIGVENGRSTGDLPGAFNPAQHIFAAAGQQLVVGFEV